MEIDYGALFGVDVGGNEQEVAEPVEIDTEAQGGNEQEVAETAEDTSTEETGEEAGENKGQSAKDNARYAAARRKAEAERDEAIKKAREEAQAEAARLIDAAFKDSGLTNPYTKKPITTKAEYDEYRARFEAEKRAHLMRKSGMTDQEFGEFVSSLPEVQEAKKAQQEAEEAVRQAREREAKIKVDEQLREIGELDPTIKSLEDLSKMETYPRFYELVKKGNSLTDAFKLANYDALTKTTAAASRQAAMNAASGKSHLAQTTQRGAGAVTVPADIKAEYRAFNPNATDAEIQQHYARYAKR